MPNPGPRANSPRKTALASGDSSSRPRCGAGVAPQAPRSYPPASIKASTTLSSISSSMACSRARQPSPPRACDVQSGPLPDRSGAEVDHFVQTVVNLRVAGRRAPRRACRWDHVYPRPGCLHCRSRSASRGSPGPHRDCEVRTMTVLVKSTVRPRPSVSSPSSKSGSRARSDVRMRLLDLVEQDQL